MASLAEPDSQQSESTRTAPRNVPSKRLRAPLHLKPSISNDVPESSAAPQKYRHGRRLIQMLFRSNNEEDVAVEAPQTASDVGVVTSPPSVHLVDARHEDNEFVEPPISTGQFSALKRKLFPSRKRRHPVRIPPLIISPIATTNQTQTRQPSFDAAMNDADDDDDDIRAISNAECRDASEIDANENEFVGADLREAILASSNAYLIQYDALAEMTSAIEGLQQWRKQHEIDTEHAMEEVIQKVDSVLGSFYQVDDSEAQLESLRLEEEYLRNQRQSEQARVQLSLALKQTEDSISNMRVEDDFVDRLLADVEAKHQAVDDQDLLKLRNDVFDLKVKELSSEIKASWLNTLEGGDDELNMKIFDIEAFTSDLDQVLAQFPLTNDNTLEGHLIRQI